MNLAGRPPLTTILLARRYGSIWFMHLNDVFANEQARRGDVQDFRVRSVHFTYD